MYCVDSAIGKKYQILGPYLDELTRRVWAGSEAIGIGRGGISKVAKETGLSRTTVRAGVRQLQSEEVQASGGDGKEFKRQRLRRAGGGRKRLQELDPEMTPALERMLEPATRGDPESPLKWTCKSAAHLAESLRAAGHPASERSVNRQLHELGFSLQSNRKTIEGRQHPDRDGQFARISRRVKAFQRMGQPVVSVDTKKKELVGAYKNGGREWHRSGEAPAVNVHDFPDPEHGKAIPYGVYDITENVGWVSVGIDHDTAAFAVESLRRWWYGMGQASYPRATRLLVTADGGGSNSSRSRLWKYQIQQLADELGLKISICHFPPGTSKWNRIEHRMFAQITQNWRGRPLISHQVIVNLIAASTTRTGLRIRAALDEGEYPLGIKISDEQMEALNIRRDRFHGEWNYTLKPRH